MATRSLISFRIALPSIYQIHIKPLNRKTTAFPAAMTANAPAVSDKAPAFFRAKPRITLGSASYSRKGILQELADQYGFSFDTIVAELDERSIGDRSKSPEQLVLELARAKAEHLVPRLKQESGSDREHYLITCDQVVVSHEGDILEKPIDADEACKFIRGYSNAFSSTVGSVLVTNLRTGKQVESVDSAIIHFSEIPDTVIEELVAEGTVFKCAGGLMIEHPFVSPLITRIDGTSDSVMGLSKRQVLECLLSAAPVSTNGEELA